jgi:tetratricopeptide (TPR) repeat protein
MADGLYTRGRFVDAATVYGKSISLGKDNANSRYRLATSLVQLERQDEAVAHLEAALALDASHGEARYLYGTLLNSMGRFAEAENEIRGARTRFDPGAHYFVELGLALLGQGKLDGAEEVARDFERYDPGDARAHTLLGEVYLKRRRFEAARQELITALQANADQPRAQLALGRVWLAIGRSKGDQGDFAKARQILQDARGIPKGERLLTLGQISLAEGDAFNAINFFENAIAQGGNRLPARLGLAEARFATQDFAGAAKELESAELLTPTDPAIALSLGLVHSQMKNFPKAAQEYLKAIHRVGLTKPVGEKSGPVVLPTPYVDVSTSFDVNRVIRDAYRRALASDSENKVASALKEIAQSTSFVISGPA